MKKISWILAIIVVLFIYFSGSGDDNSKVMENPFEDRYYKLGGSNDEFGTFIQFTEKNKLWMATYQNEINSNSTDGTWEYIDESKKIIKITMENGNLNDYSGIYQLNDEIRELFRAVGNDTTRFYTDFED
jgi:hypothetical protein